MDPRGSAPVSALWPELVTVPGNNANLNGGPIPPKSSEPVETATRPPVVLPGPPLTFPTA